MGVVYRAFDPSLEREVAIKSVRLDGTTEAEIAQLEERLAREARAAAKLQHQNIVSVYDFFREGDRAYIVMEFIRGSSLDAMTLGDTRPALPRVQELIRQAAAALDYAHANGIVHRDIKPANLMLDQSGTLKITDFGIARQTHAGATQTMAQGPGISTAGTLGYMAPEQIQGAPVTGQADQFSLAVVAYQLLTGKMPWEAENWIALSYQILNNPAPAAPPGAEAITRALAKNPDERFASCGEFAAALGGAAIGMAGGSAGAGAAAPAASKARRRPPRVAMIGAGLLLAIAVVVFRPKEVTQEPVKAPSASATVAPVAATDSPAAAVEAPKEEAKPELPSVPALPIDFAAIPAGRFHMGSDAEADDQKPRRLVNISKPFELSTTEVTERQWNSVLGRSGGSNKPVTNVSYVQIQGFLAKLNQRQDGFVYRLPTEAEWEYAARGGSGPERPGNAADVAWYADNAPEAPQEVAKLAPNKFGLFDMLGNVHEWVADWAADDYSSLATQDPKGPAAGQARVFRGGSYTTQGMMLTPTWRFAAPPDHKSEELGFRLARHKK
jgi:formylglycine-generating enzyme required for sulfatase activity/predicted Ser/Thr protein kinase